jgi:hypothetical protein
MSRSGYSDDCDDNWALIRWRGAVASAIRGKRGQQTLREIAAALDAMPVKALAAESLVTEEGAFCTLGALGAARGIDMAPIDPNDREAVAQAFGISEALAAEVMFENDEAIDEFRWVDVEVCGPLRQWDRRMQSIREPVQHAAERRWQYMRQWVQANIKPESA